MLTLKNAITATEKYDDSVDTFLCTTNFQNMWSAQKIASVFQKLTNSLIGFCKDHGVCDALVTITNVVQKALD